LSEPPIKCQCGLWFATEDDFQDHIKKHSYGFNSIKKLPREVKIDFHKHGRGKKI
jgi:uncharacterized C2H2 Zn-finger protein